MNYEMDNLRKKSEKELNKELSEKNIQSLELRFAIANNQVKNIREARSLKKNIARILTNLNERQKDGK